MKYGEKLFNIFLGLSLVYWGIAGFWAHYDGMQTSPVRLCITLLNLAVGILIILREPIKANGSTASILISLPSFICGGLIFKLARPLPLWEGHLEVLFILGGTLTLSAFLFLGRSFAILPGRREIVSRGLFRLLRHPAYLGECLMMLACLLATASLWALISFAIFVPGIVFRIKAEEKILLESADYQAYAREVSWRLIPYVW